LLKRNLFHVVLAFSFCASAILGCAPGVKKADIASTANPKEEVSKLNNDLKSAVTKNIDILAASEFKESKRYLTKAKTAIEEGKNQEGTLESLRIGRGYLDKAYEVAQGREGKAVGLFAARQMALDAGADKHSELQDELADLDSDLSDKADDLQNTSAEKISDFQQRYVKLEEKAVVLTELGKAQAIVNGARRNDASDKAPVSFKKAELSLNTAESMITSNVRNPMGYKASVFNANKDAAQLMNVLSTIRKNGSLEESVAIKMVAQDKKITGLITDLDVQTAMGVAGKSAMRNKNAELASANSQVKIQAVLEKARAQFSASEAEAYQQGSNLVIRLKQVNFASGRADLPADSLAILAKVSDVAKSLNASQIIIEGHTDSVGTASINKAISEKRASAVAAYFKSNGLAETKIDAEGYGFNKPIATNKSKEGRAQNRRVDIIITPEAVEL
jgi:outer membrane protein OmpA-like peptidoglycan-associated protein